MGVMPWLWHEYMGRKDSGKENVVMRKQKNRGPERLPDSELAVMKMIWGAGGSVGTGYLAKELESEKGWSRSTIQVLLARLEEKGFVKCKKEGRCKYYTPLVSEEAYRKAETKTFLEQFYHDSYKGLIAALVQEEDMSEEDIQEILQIIRKGS